MAEHVGRYVPGLAHSIQIFADDPPDRLRRKRPSSLVKKNSSLLLDLLCERIAIFLYELEQFRRCDLKYTLFSALSLNQKP